MMITTTTMNIEANSHHLMEGKMNDRLHEQLEEMEQQLSQLEGAIEAIQNAKIASVESIGALNSAQAQLSESCKELVPELKSQFNGFAEHAEEILESLKAHLQALQEIDMSALEKTLAAHKEELGKQVREQLDSNNAALQKLLGGQSDEIKGFVDSSLDKQTAQIREDITSLRKHVDSGLDNQTAKLQEDAMTRSEGLLKDVDSSLDKQTVQIREGSLENTEAIRAQIALNEPIIKQAKAFGLIAAIMSIAAAVVAAIGLFM